MITIVDYNMGNIGSIRNMLRKSGIESETTSDPDKIQTSTRLILPGVGSFDAGMENLQKRDLIDVLNERVLKAKVPTLGICLGMQLMAHESEEGNRNGLGWISARARRFQSTSSQYKVPHMGWNLVSAVRGSPLLYGLPAERRFYFVHSYYVHCDEESDVLLTTHYGFDFHSAFQRENIAGVQFHPEKSHKFGMKLLENFARWEPMSC